MKPHWHLPPGSTHSQQAPQAPGAVPSWALAEPRNPTDRTPVWFGGSFPSNTLLLTELLPLQAMLLQLPGCSHLSWLPGASLTLLEELPGASLTLLQELPSLQAAPAFTAGSLLSGPGLNHLAFIHSQVAGKSLAPPPASGDGKTESYLPIQGPLIPGQSPAEKAKRKHAVLPWCVGGWREHAK